MKADFSSQTRTLKDVSGKPLRLNVDGTLTRIIAAFSLSKKSVAFWHRFFAEFTEARHFRTPLNLLTCAGFSWSAWWDIVIASWASNGTLWDCDSVRSHLRSEMNETVHLSIHVAVLTIRDGALLLQALKCQLFPTGRLVSLFPPNEWSRVPIESAWDHYRLSYGRSFAIG